MMRIYIDIERIANEMAQHDKVFNVGGDHDPESSPLFSEIYNCHLEEVLDGIYNKLKWE